MAGYSSQATWGHWKRSCAGRLIGGASVCTGWAQPVKHSVSIGPRKRARVASLRLSWSAGPGTDAKSRPAGRDWIAPIHVSANLLQAARGAFARRRLALEDPLNFACDALR